VAQRGKSIGDALRPWIGRFGLFTRVGLLVFFEYFVWKVFDLYTHLGQ
jgi:hypothetical protein